MGKRLVLTVIVVLAATKIAVAQQVADLNYKPPIARPAYESGKGPRVVIDAAHHNFHTAEGALQTVCQALAARWLPCERPAPTVCRRVFEGCGCRSHFELR